jgi:hypothetical protein
MTRSARRPSGRGFARCVATAVILAASVLLPAPAAAAPSVKLVVDSTAGQPNAGEPELWAGTIFRDGPRIPDIPECQTVSCEHVQVRVNLPSKIWQARPGGVHFAIRFINGTPDDNLALVVYRDGVRIGASTAQVATAQSVLIPSAKNGTYHVYVVDGIAFGNAQPSPVIAYEGLAQVHYDPVRVPVRDLLPDLVALPQKSLTFGPPFPIFDDPPSEAFPSCHQSEVDEDGAQTCLRFDQVLGNIGAGPLDIRFDLPAGLDPVEGQPIPVRQRIYRSDGSFQDSPSGDVHFHAIHGHYHFDGFAQSVLWAIDSEGNRAGAAPVATGNKVSFCIATTSINPAYWGQQAFGPDAYPAPDCLEPYATSGGFDHFKQGMSVGWTDEYNWFLPGQYVEVTGVPDGDYILDTTVDPTARLFEELKTNNCGSVRVRLTGMGTSQPQAELLPEPGPACQ